MQILNRLLPHVCLLCHHLTTRKQDLCEGCYQALPILTQGCSLCANPLCFSKHICGTCLEDPPPFDRVITSFLYQPPISGWILQLKFSHQLHLAKLLGELLAEKIQQESGTLPDCILPVPLHQKRIQERGFNQALEIARPIAKKLKIPLYPLACLRQAYTSANAKLHADARQKNLKNAFAVTRDFSGMHVAIVDDVMSTGCTVRELSLTLKKHGAKRIEIWCCARPAYIIHQKIEKALLNK